MPLSYQPCKWTGSVNQTHFDLWQKAQGQSRRTSGEVIHLKVIFRETGGRRRERGGIQPYHHCWMDERWNKQTETSINTKWKNLISLLTDWISIAPVCCLVTSHCPAHFQMLIRWETINKSMAAGCWPDCFRGEREVGPLVCREVDLNRDVMTVSNTSAGFSRAEVSFHKCDGINKSVVIVRGWKIFHEYGEDWVEVMLWTTIMMSHHEPWDPPVFSLEVPSCLTKICPPINHDPEQTPHDVQHNYKRQTRSHSK